MGRVTAAPRVLPLLLQCILALAVWNPALTSAKWATLSGNAPVVIANGGTSGLYPDQTLDAYLDAINYSLPGVVLSCDLQLARALRQPDIATGTGICRTGLDLSKSTAIAQYAPQLNNTYVIDGKPTRGYYAIDIPYENLTTLAPAIQSNNARPPVYDSEYTILKPEYLPQILPNNSGSNWWLNSEYTRFVEENSKFNATSLLLGAIANLYPGYVSVPEIDLLRKVQVATNSTGAKAIYKFLPAATMDASTNQTYDSLLGNLTFLSTVADGILVPKSYVWPISVTTSYYLPHTTLVNDAHRVGLEVYVYDFANDQFPNFDQAQTSFNSTFDPVSEILFFIERYNFSVDGLFTDFPTTASEAIGCYAANSRNGTAQSKAAATRQTIISHNGASGVYPGATTAAYYSAIDSGVDYIDCTVQISLDSVPFCRTTINLIDTTTVATTALFETYLKTYPELGSSKGVFSFDLTWAQISTLASIMYSPSKVKLSRDKSYNGQFGILSLADFLSIAKNHSVGALIDIQNAVYLRQQHNLAVVDAVAGVLAASGYNSTDMVIMQSDQSAVLARLVELNVTYPRMYLVTWTSVGEGPVTLTSEDFVEIKKYASSVNLDERLVDPYNSQFYLKGPPTNLMDMAHAQNLTTYYQYHRNEFSAFAFDFKADTTLQLYSLIHYGIDGIITDFPDTVAKYFQNQCLNNGLLSSTMNFSIPLVVPGVLGNETYQPVSPSPAPAPNLVVPQPPLTGVAYVPSPGPAPSSLPSAASHTSPFLLVLAMASILLHLLAMV